MKLSEFCPFLPGGFLSCLVFCILLLGEFLDGNEAGEQERVGGSPSADFQVLQFQVPCFAGWVSEPHDPHSTFTVLTLMKLCCAQ